jgi:DNA-binding GntR family transcriptional regulator
LPNEVDLTSDRTYRKKAHTAERVAAELRRAIQRRDLLPGEHVRQEYWAQKLGVSSAPTREALKVLVAEQLLNYDAHRGYFVARIDPAEMEQLYLLRRLIEAEVLRKIRWPDAEELVEIRKLMDTVVDRMHSGDGHGALEAAREFSFTIFDLSPDELLVRETKRYFEMASVYRALTMGLVREPSAENMARFYDEFHAHLEHHDRRGLIALNSRQRSSVPHNVQF